jgi:hypothetical protein
MTIRCVVTGQTPEGRSAVVADEQVEPAVIFVTILDPTRAAT